jgi:hypothetical protein
MAWRVPFGQGIYLSGVATMSQAQPFSAELPSSSRLLLAQCESLHREQWVPRPLAEVFPFFAEARNLEELTPPFLSFHILTPEVKVRPRALIDYRLRLHGVPLRWRTIITDFEPGRRFVDEQLRGPYRVWRHEHTFEEQNGGTLLTDHVQYLAPGGPLAPLVHRLFVRGDLVRIFDYRKKIIEEKFSKAPTGK